MNQDTITRINEELTIRTRTRADDQPTAEIYVTFGDIGNVRVDLDPQEAGIAHFALQHAAEAGGSRRWTERARRDD